MWKENSRTERNGEYRSGYTHGASVYLRDVATVVDSVEERAQETYNNGVQGAMIVVQKQSGANSVNISRKVMDAVAEVTEVTAQ